MALEFRESSPLEAVEQCVSELFTLFLGPRREMAVVQSQGGHVEVLRRDGEFRSRMQKSERVKSLFLWLFRQ